MTVLLKSTEPAALQSAPISLLSCFPAHINRRQTGSLLALLICSKPIGERLLFCLNAESKALLLALSRKQGNNVYLCSEIRAQNHNLPCIQRRHTSSWGYSNNSSHCLPKLCRNWIKTLLACRNSAEIGPRRLIHDSAGNSSRTSPGFHHGTAANQDSSEGFSFHSRLLSCFLFRSVTTALPLPDTDVPSALPRVLEPWMSTHFFR